MDTLLYFNRIPKTGSENFAFLIDQLAKVINSLLKSTSLKNTSYIHVFGHKCSLPWGQSWGLSTCTFYTSCGMSQTFHCNNYLLNFNA